MKGAEFVISECLSNTCYLVWFYVPLDLHIGILDTVWDQSYDMLAAEQNPYLPNGVDCYIEFSG